MKQICDSAYIIRSSNDYVLVLADYSFYKGTTPEYYLPWNEDRDYFNAFSVNPRVEISESYLDTINKTLTLLKDWFR